MYGWVNELKCPDLHNFLVVMSHCDEVIMNPNFTTFSSHYFINNHTVIFYYLFDKLDGI